jgi:hypothetical protein
MLVGAVGAGLARSLMYSSLNPGADTLGGALLFAGVILGMLVAVAGLWIAIRR